MKAYRWILLDSDGRFAKVIALDCDTDEQAEQRCREVLDDQLQPQAELWRGPQFLKRWQSSRLGKSTAQQATIRRIEANDQDPKS